MSTTQAMRPARKLHRPSFTTLALVGALHIVVIYGLYLGLTGKMPGIIHGDPIQVVPVTPTKPPPISDPTHVKMFQPGVPGIKPPVIQIESTQPRIDSLETNYGQTNTNVSPLPVIVAARGIDETHTIPNYPLLSIRLGQTGDVKLKLTIDERGTVVAASVEKSSGYDALDSAAVAWVIAHWRYEPATKDGKPFATTRDALVTFRLTGR
jgi:periplasmic protein TonB